MRFFGPLVLMIFGAAELLAQTILNPGADLQAVVTAAAAGSTLLLNAGAYTLPSTLVVTKGLTIKNNQATRPTLQVPAGTVHSPAFRQQHHIRRDQHLRRLVGGLCGRYRRRNDVEHCDS